MQYHGKSQDINRERTLRRDPTVHAFRQLEDAAIAFTGAIGRAFSVIPANDPDAGELAKILAKGERLPHYFATIARRQEAKVRYA